MLKNKLAIFIAKRVLIYCILLSIIDVILIENRWYTLAGLIFGSAFSVLKFRSYSWLFDSLIPDIASTARKTNSARISILGFLINQILLLPILFVSFFLNQWFFAGIVSGLLLVPFVIMINCITEVLKITRNNFE